MRPRPGSLALGFAALAAALAAQNESEFAELLQRTEGRIADTIAEYQAFLQATSEERLALVSETNQLENDLVQLRRLSRQAENEESRRNRELEETRGSIQQLETQVQYANGVLAEYLTGFESRLHHAEDQRYLAPLTALRQSLDAAGDSPRERMPLFFEAIEMGLARQEALLDGDRFAGRAVTPQGGVEPGEVLLFGPTAYFATPDAATVGMLRFNSGTIEPGLQVLPAEAEETLRQLFRAGEGSLVVDASMGGALSLSRARGSLVEHLQKGGWVGYVILCAGAMMLLVSLWKLKELRETRLSAPPALRPLATAALAGSSAEVTALLAPVAGPLRAMLEVGLEFIQGDASALHEAMEAAILRHRPRLERFLPLLSTIASAAPLLGLLGTVVGMIKTFTLIEVFGTGDAKSLSSGISEALVTTELGLIVAIPALVLHGLFTRVMRGRLAEMEQVATEFGNQVSAAKSEG